MRLRYCCTFLLGFFLFAVTAFAHEVPCKEEVSFDEKLAALSLKLEKIEEMKGKKDPAWEGSLATVYHDLVKLGVDHKSSPMLYFLFAKSYYLNDSVRKAIKATEKAVFFKPDYLEALIFQGELYTEDISKQLGFEPPADIESTFHMQRKNAVEAYEAALKVQGLDKETESAIYLKLGNLNAIFPYRKKAAREFWQKASETAPESSSAKTAIERLQKN